MERTLSTVHFRSPLFGCLFAALFITPVGCSTHLAFPHQSVAFANGDVRLSGALVKPAGPGPFPAVVLIHGAGPGIYDNPWFRMHANAFVRHGFAVLLYDKRGSGASTGNLETSDFDDLAGDVLAGVQFLRARSDIAPMQVGVLGLSEGGWIGPLAARRDTTLAFVIMCSGSAVNPIEQTLYWTRTAMREHGAPDSVIARAVKLKLAAWEYTRSVAVDSVAGFSPRSFAIRDSLVAELQPFDHYRPEVPAGVPNPAKRPLAYFRANAHMMYYDPAPTFAALRSPLLEVLGDEDKNVEPATSIAVLERLKATGRDVTIRTFHGVGHSLTRYSRIEPLSEHRFPRGYMETLTTWARERVDRVDRAGTR